MVWPVTIKIWCNAIIPTQYASESTAADLMAGPGFQAATQYKSLDAGNLREFMQGYRTTGILRAQCARCLKLDACFHQDTNMNLLCKYIGSIFLWSQHI